MTEFDISAIQARKILLWGAGGGYDIYAGFFLYKLLSKNNDVYLANYSFSDDLFKYGKTENDIIVEIIGNETRTEKNIDYFPEYILAQFLKKSVFAGRLFGPDELSKSIDKLLTSLLIDLVILVDAGHDALLFGDEGRTRGSPLEDMTSIVSFLSNNTSIEKMLCCISVPTEDIPMELFYKHLAVMKCVNGFLGQYIPDKDNVSEFEQLLDLTPEDSRSIPNECLLAAMQDKFGEHYKNPRLKIRMDRDECTDNDYPDITYETKIHWFFDINKLHTASPLIKHLFENGRKLNSIRFHYMINTYYGDDKYDDYY
jgi:hypothetical protein